MNRIKNFASLFVSVLVAGIFLISGIQANALVDRKGIYLSCKADNDLFITLKDNRISCLRCDTPEEAVDKAGEGSAVLILADGYPEKTTQLNPSFFESAREKNLRLFIEYPSFLPGIDIGSPRGTHWERAVISSDAFAPAVGKLRILAIHGCRYLPIKADNPLIVVARVAGFDRAVFGLPEETFPILQEFPQPEGIGGLLVSTTKLSQFLTARYAPADAWRAIWNYILSWASPVHKIPDLKWTPCVRPTYNAGKKLPANTEKTALQRGIDWFFNSNMLLHPAMMEQYNKPANLPVPSKVDPDLTQDWPYGHRVARMGKNLPAGDGTLGIMEGFDARIFSDGSQPVRWWNRNDCNGEVAGAMGMAGKILKNNKYLTTAVNIGDWLYFKSMMSNGDRADPQNPAYGLFGWNDSPKYAGPAYGDGYGVYYGDDNARSLLGVMMLASASQTDRYNERMLKCLLANLRMSGIYGFQHDRVDQGPLVKAGWEHYFTEKYTSFSPHYQANLWACYLWAYHQTGFSLFLDRARTGIKMTMDAYPDQWKWTNGIQQERAKMLLCLSWLVRVEDTPEHRGWLERIAKDLLSGQVGCGAIREELGEAGKGGFPPPSSNKAYGTSEASLIQTNEDGVSDLLYTTNFAFLGLHEAAAATGEKIYRETEDKLAGFLCRIQIRSEKHPELDGGWFRAFDFNRWEYWASNADAGWGAWCIETGWTQSWITAVLALRQVKASLWEFTSDSNVENHFDLLRRQMLPDEILKKTNNQ